MFKFLEKNPFFFTVFLFIVVAFAGLVEILPGFAQASRPVADTKPYTVLELAGKNIYVKENCMSCHSQLVRPFKSETDRYGMYSLSGEYAYDRPFLWGSKRTGPDLHRVGNYRTTDWHENHMLDPSAIVPGSVMPRYPWLFDKSADLNTAYAEAVTVKTVFNTPYDVEGMPSIGASFEDSKKIMLEEAAGIVEDMKDERVKEAYKNGEIKEIVALIAYLNRLK
ncbi:MAG: cytochrome-c oxidase, cbb3-type subunit II [Helicobacteraceae bacterium]